MITLSLENFRCWENNTFTFPDHGICLIHGRSGRGKSTLLNAIYYAINGKLKNITTFGKKTTKVTLFIENDTISIKLIRTRNPVRLVVEFENKKYEDEEAQTIIDRHFGKFFGSTSYIDQENTYSFFSLSSSDKMEFLENLLMEEQSIELIREKIKTQISDSKIQFASIESKISSLSEVLNTSNVSNIHSLTIGENKVTPSNVDLLVEKVTKNLSVTTTNSTISLSKIKKLEENLQTFHIKAQIKELYEELDKLSEFKSKNDLLSLQTEKDHLFYRKEWIKLEKSIQDCQEEIKEKKNELESHMKLLGDINYENKEKIIQSKKWLEHLLELDEKMNQSLINKDSEKKWIEDQHCHLEHLKDLLYKLELAKKSLNCPSCNATLQIVNDHLEEIDLDLKNNTNDTNTTNDTKKEYEKQQLIFKNRKKIFDSYLHMEEEYNHLYNKVEEQLNACHLEIDIDHVNESIEKIQKFEEYKKKIANLQEDRLLKSLYSQKETLQKKIKNEIVDDTDDVDDLDDPEKKYNEIVEKLALFNDKYERYHLLWKKKQELEKNIENINKNNKKDEKDENNKNDDDDKNNEKDDEFTNEKLETERKKYSEYEEKKEKYRNYLEKLREWKLNLEEYQKREKIEYQIEKEKERRDDYNDRMKGLIKLRDYIKIAEKKCLEEFIQSLNRHASIYLEHFFQDEDLKVQLKSTQELKNGKEKICLNFEVNYRDLIGDLSYLSGGERDRVTLAFTLAFSELIHPSLLMLDECISSLDAETTANVLDTLKEKYKGKLILLVSHQANLGFFDTVINI